MIDAEGLLVGTSAAPWRLPSNYPGQQADCGGGLGGLLTGYPPHFITIVSDKMEEDDLPVMSLKEKVSALARAGVEDGMSAYPGVSSNASSTTSSQAGCSSPDKMRQGSAFSSSSDETDSTDSGRSSKKHPWTPEEDEALRGLVKKHGPRDWGKIAAQLKNRNGKQCHQRWNYFLNPDVRKGVWSEDEDRTVMYWQRLLGNKWAKIAGYLPGRTGHAVKNRFHQMSNGIKRRRWGQISAGPSSPTSSSAAVSSSTAQGMPTTDVSKAWGKSQAYSTGANGGPLLSHHHHPHDQPHHHHRHHHMSQQPMMGMDHQMAAHHHHLQQQQDAAYSEHMLRAEQQGPPSGQHYHHLQLQAPSQHHLHPSQHMHATHQQLLEQHQHESLKYPWQDCDDCPTAYQYAPYPTTNPGMMGDAYPRAGGSKGPGSSGLPYYHGGNDDLDLYYQQTPYPMLQPGGPPPMDVSGLSPAPHPAPSDPPTSQAHSSSAPPSPSIRPTAAPSSDSTSQQPSSTAAATSSSSSSATSAPDEPRPPSYSAPGVAFNPASTRDFPLSGGFAFH